MENEFKDFIIETVNKIMKPNVVRKDLMAIITEDIIEKINKKLNKMHDKIQDIGEECDFGNRNISQCNHRNFGGESNKCKWCIDLEKLFYEQK